jgi:hypothetical protein
MSMSPEQAANQLRDKLAAPSWAVSIWPWRGEVVSLIVKVDADYSIAWNEIPSEFEGFPVTVEHKQSITAHGAA